MKNLRNANRAFTLVEIMIVVLIIGILLAIAIPNFIKAREQSRAKSCQANLKQIDSAKQQYAMDAKIAGDSSDVITDAQLVGTTAAPGYLKSIPTCPANGTYANGNINTDPTCTVGALALQGTTYYHTLTGK